MVYVIPHEGLHEVNKKTKSLNANQKSIFNSLKLFLVFFQTTGILPQENITTSQNDLRFTWKSWKVIYTLVLIGMTVLQLALSFLDLCLGGYDFTKLVRNVFYAGTLTTLILYLRLARSWSKLMLFWCKVDERMNYCYGYPKTLDKRFRIVSGLYLVTALMNCTLSLTSKSNMLQHKYGNGDDIQLYYLETFPQVFRFLQFNAFVAAMCSVTEIYSNLIRDFNDLFIILLSIPLALRFKQISERLVSNKRMVKSMDFWKEIREDYDRLSILCKELDKHISYLILLSFSLNIFILLVQLYDTFQYVNGFIQQLYFVFSLIYTIFKVVSVSLYAAWINDESGEPASLLNSVSTTSYNIEIRRLLRQISFDGVALTGCRMFRVTRGIILSIAGAIVTYELVLIQFNAATIAAPK